MGRLRTYSIEILAENYVYLSSSLNILRIFKTEALEEDQQNDNQIG